MSKEQQIEEHASTVEEAIEAGLARLGLAREWVDIEIIDEGRRGLLGIGGREAVVRLTVRSHPPARVEQQAQVAGPVEQVVVAPKQEEEEALPVMAEVEEADLDEEPSTKGMLAADDAEAAAAVQIIKSLLEKMDVTAAVEASLTERDDLTGRRLTAVNITGDDLGLLIGSRGETLDALQHLARLMVGHQIRQRAYFVIDIDGYRQRREQALARLAQRMGKKAVDRGRPVTLEPMPAFERRIIHITLREDPQVRTESTGEGDRRRVRIFPL